MRRSLLTLKALVHARTGGMLAAATSSLPERPGGTRNWDYRFCWLRDAAFTLVGFLNTGHVDEARAWIIWLRRALAGVVEALEQGVDLRREVRQIHVVDEVVEGAEDAEGAGRLERGPVLDVAPLESVVPVHAADPVAVGADPGDHLGAGDRRHRGETGDAVVDQHAALDQGAEVRRPPLVDRPPQHVGAERVDVGEDQLLLAALAGHR